MSKQSEAKAKQGYIDKPNPPVCMHCAFYRSEIGHYDNNPDYPKEINIRCGIGEFAVKKLGTCNRFQRK